MEKFLYLPRYIAIKTIKAYQKFFSFDHSKLKHFFPYGFCRFHPTCSEYAIQAIEKHGLLKGGLMAVWRVLRCNPWNQGGIDPVK